MKDLKIIFIGTADFSVIILEKLCQSQYKPILVITKPDKPVGRKKILLPPSVKVVAKNYQILTEQPDKIEDCKLKIENLKPDLIVVAAYGQILPKEILKIPKFGCLNLHPSLLPKWRGPTPIQFALLSGDKISGVTIFLMDKKVDHGPILAQRSIKIEEDETAETLHNKLAHLGANLLLEIIPNLVKGLIKLQVQNDAKATYSKILSREDGKIDWKKSAKEIERQIRAFNLWPESYCLFEKDNKKLRLKILKAGILSQNEYSFSGEPGKTFLAPGNKIAVQTGKDYLIIEKLQLEGKKPMTGEEFLKGHPNFLGKILE